MIDTITKLSDIELLDLSVCLLLTFSVRNDKLIIFFHRDIKLKEIQAQYEIYSNSEIVEEIIIVREYLEIKIYNFFLLRHSPISI